MNDIEFNKILYYIYATYNFAIYVVYPNIDFWIKIIKLFYFYIYMLRYNIDEVYNNEF